MNLNLVWAATSEALLFNPRKYLENWQWSLSTGSCSHLSRFSLSYAPHTSEVYNNIGLNRALKSLLQVSIDNFLEVKKTFYCKNTASPVFSIYTVVVVIVVAAMAILVVVFIFHHCWCCFQFLLSPLLISIKNRNILHRWAWASKVNSVYPINKTLKLQISFRIFTEERKC